MNIKAHHDYQRHAINWGGNAERERYTLMSGFSVKRLTEKDMKWAPAGRDHKLECMVR